MKKRLLSVLLTATLAISLIACGKQEAPENYEDSSYSDGNGSAQDSLGTEASGQSSEKKNKDSKGSKDGSFTIYRVDGSKLHFCLQSDKCETMVPAEEYGEGKSALIVMIENSNNAQFNATSSYASYGYDDNGGWVNVSAPYENGYTCFRNMYAATFEGDNLFNGFKDGDSFSAYVVDQNNWDISDKTLAVSGKIKIEDISEEEFSKVLFEEAKNYKPSKKANEAWAGNYFTEYYDTNSSSSVYGYATIEVTDSGAISLFMTTDKGTEAYILEETEYDEAHYDYGDVISGRAKAPGRNGSNQELSLGIEPDYSYMSFSDSSNGQYISYSFYEYREATAASADYPDKDQYGKVDSFIKTMPSSLLPGGTDDYVVTYSENDTAYVYNGNNYTEYPCELYRVWALDVNGICSLESYVYCMENDGAAAAVYAYQEKNGYTVSRNGNTIFCSYYGYGSKDYVINNNYAFQIYKGMHYCYPKQYEGSEQNKNTMYVSKPETGDSLSFEEIARLRMKEYGSHRSIDSQDASLHYGFYYDSYYGTYSFSLSVYANDFASADSAIKIVGENEFLSMGYDRYDGYIYVNEYNLAGDEGIVTQYKYKCNDFDNPSVTFDNYKNQTPEVTVSHRFDMTRVE